MGDIARGMIAPPVMTRFSCICQPLHLNCNPSTCKRAPRNRTFKSKNWVAGTSSNSDSAEIVCHRGELRDAALRGCITCPILYAGIAGSDNAPVVGDDSWPRVEKDEYVNIKIKARGELVHCKLSCAFPGTTRNYRHPINLVFYASWDSGTFPASVLCFSNFLNLGSLHIELQ